MLSACLVSSAGRCRCGASVTEYGAPSLQLSTEAASTLHDLTACVQPRRAAFAPLSMRLATGLRRATCRP